MIGGGCMGARPRGTRRTAARWRWAALAAFAGCGYTLGPDYRGAETVAVPIFDNQSLWRGQEFDLTNAVVREVATRTPYRIVARPARADLVVRGRIVSFTQPAVVQGAVDSVLQGSVWIQIEITIENGRTGETVSGPTRYWDGASLIPARGETLDTARAEVFDKLAQWVVRQLERPW